MKQRIRYIFAALVVVFSLVAPATVWAENGTSSSDNTTSTQSTDSSDTSSSDDVSQIETGSHTREDRLSKLKTAFKVRLTLKEISSIKLKCVGAQGKVSRLKSHFGEKVVGRTKAYDNLEARLDKLVTKLKDQNVDTTTLEQQITELKNKISTFHVDLAAYKQSLDDLKTVSCKADPDGFQAALQAARSAHDRLINDAKAIKTYLSDTIKPTLQSIKQQLGDKKEPV